MVFSSLCYRKDYGCGKAFILPVSTTIHDFNDIFVEAQALWSAERNKCGSSIYSNWGAVGLLANPFQKNLNHIINEWESYFNSQIDKPELNSCKTEKPSLSRNGLLGIHWPRNYISNEPVDLDFIIATVNNATVNNAAVINKYPTHIEIARAWINDVNNNEQYFINNVMNGICTFQDKRIWENVKHLNPGWLEKMERQQIALLDELLLS